MAIDRQQIVNALVYGFGEPWADGPVPMTHTRLPRGRVHPPRSRWRAPLLAEAGWRPGPTASCATQQGRQLRFTIITNAGNDVRRDMAEVIQAQLRPLGIAVQPGWWSGTHDPAAAGVAPRGGAASATSTR
jgi:peptide/nickel transport system substrate-binding protein